MPSSSSSSNVVADKVGASGYVIIRHPRRSTGAFLAYVANLLSDGDARVLVLTCGERAAAAFVDGIAERVVRGDITRKNVAELRMANGSHVRVLSHATVTHVRCAPVDVILVMNAGWMHPDTYRSVVVPLACFGNTRVILAMPVDDDVDMLNHNSEYINLRGADGELIFHQETITVA
jgi:hypothetical protein